ncbi:MAG: radical SAM protein [Magnetococcales bacterium]|nr:radical SAM protein [Magnetococcales bacterium]
MNNSSLTVSISIWTRTFQNFIISGLRNSKPGFFIKLIKGFVLVKFFGKKKIQYIEIMITHACNAKCDFCSNTYYDRRGRSRLLNPEKVKKLIDEAASMDVPLICFLGGEPLLDPHLFSYVEYTWQKGMMAMVASNGQLLNKDNLSRLKESHIGKIVVTIYSTDPKVNDEVTRFPGYLERAIDAIKLGKSMGIGMAIKTVVDSSHFASGEIDRIIALAQKLEVPLSVNPVVPTGAALFNYQDKILDISLQYKLDELVRRHSFMSTHLNANYFGYGCPAGIAYLGITAYGDAIPCFFMPVSYGNVWDLSLKEIHDKILQTPLFKVGAKTCVAAYDKDLIRDLIRPCFVDESLSKQVPVPVENHPKYDKVLKILEISEK